MDSTLSTAALAALETAINKALDYDPGTRIALGKLEGQVLAVTLTAPALTVYLLPGQDQLYLASYWEGSVDTRLRGSLPALIKLATSDTTSLHDSGVEVIGHTGLLQTLQQILRNLDLDWEEALSQLLGDIAGHESAELLRTKGRWLKDRASTVQHLLSDFLTEELGSLPARAELEDFYDAVDQVRLAVDRAQARLDRLRARSAAPTTPKDSL